MPNKMKTNTFKDQVIQYIKANPGATTFDIKCNATNDPLSNELTNRVASTISTLVSNQIITREHINTSKPHLGYQYWYNVEYVKLPEAPRPKSKVDQHTDFILNLIETKPGITSGRISSQFAILHDGNKTTARTILQKLLADKLVKRQAIQAGNNTAGFFYWPIDAVMTHMVAPTVKRVPPPLQPKVDLSGPIAKFQETQTNAVTSELAQPVTEANIEIAIRLCEIEAYRNPDKFKEFMLCAENIRKVANIAV